MRRAYQRAMWLAVGAATWLRYVATPAVRRDGPALLAACAAWLLAVACWLASLA